MQITRVETVTLTDLSIDETGWVAGLEDDYRKLLFVRLHTDEGTVGLGETYPRPTVDAAVIHEHIAPHLVGTEVGSIEDICGEIQQQANYFGGYAGAEMRALSAVDIALWDLKARELDRPLYEVLGGKVRDRLRTYNTCYESEYDFTTEPVALAEDLLNRDITAMKIWPFDEIGAANDGQYVTESELRDGAEPLRLIREALGNEMEVAMEFHGMWELPAAKRIAAHLEQYAPMWLEELVAAGDLRTYERLADATSLPLCVSERLMGVRAYADLLDRAPPDVVMLDIEWVGGLTEARKVATLAQSQRIPMTLHNCGGPVLHFASVHLGAALPNLKVVESVRNRYDGWHRNLVTENAEIEDGRLVVPDGPGLGTELSEHVLEMEGVDVRVSD